MELRYKGQTIGGGTASVAEEVYSTEETRIGTWFGKPFYRAGIIGTTPSNSSTSTINYYTIPGVNMSTMEFVRAFGHMQLDANNRTPIPYANISSTGDISIAAVWRPNYRGIAIRVSEAFVSKPMVLAVEYTKTTDEPETIEVSPAERAVLADAKSAEYEIPKAATTATTAGI